ncbi:hypothetical protein AMAG_00595 [Allomyces macrogynus ATCC 38327]|uniref:Peptidase S54 rhomboid domain-containing protein n=1 Tax=Allomyces macrogynus (strain ATCC 38327) TaxID=578462 RepID=A0A0L0RWZ3_ALLM3|nr:hypothetical protein AMAG_00595 [Allomyces macrogynus ATCC 38327]|eukprot:KNE54634.1 hypothetical protein AMAG_00595 [Allomyces macrogynus ATCC 38327]
MIRNLALAAARPLSATSTSLLYPQPLAWSTRNALQSSLLPRRNLLHSTLLSRAFSTTVVARSPRSSPVHQPATEIDVDADEQSSHSGQRRVRYLRPMLFAVGGSFAAFLLGVYSYDQQQYAAVSGAGGRRILTLREVLMRRREDAEEARAAILRRVARWPGSIPLEAKKAVAMVVNKWFALHDSQKTMAGLIAINAAVFLLWQLPHPAVQRFMYQWFTHNPLSGKSITLLTSMFSHQTALHLGLNMFGLWSFGSFVHHTFGGREEFLAFYIAAGLLSGFGSHLLTLRTMQHANVLPSLGASGALFACLGVTTVQAPDANVGLAFVPVISTPIKYVFPGLVALDLVGVVRNWRLFDHFAHLSGSMFGFAYMTFGREILWYNTLEKYIELKHGLAVKTGRA